MEAHSTKCKPKTHQSTCHLLRETSGVLINASISGASPFLSVATAPSISKESEPSWHPQDFHATTHGAAASPTKSATEMVPQSVLSGRDAAPSAAAMM